MESFGSPPITKFDRAHRDADEHGRLLGGTIGTPVITVSFGSDPEVAIRQLSDALRDQLLWLQQHNYDSTGFLQAALEENDKTRQRLNQYSQDRAHRGVTGTNAP